MSWTWTCPSCLVDNLAPAPRCRRCGTEHGVQRRPLAFMPARPDEPPVTWQLTPEEDAEIKRQLARFRALLQLPPRPDTPPEPKPIPEPTPTPVRVLARRVLARREVPPKPGWWRKEAS